MNIRKMFSGMVAALLIVLFSSVVQAGNVSMPEFGTDEATAVANLAREMAPIGFTHYEVSTEKQYTIHQWYSDPIDGVLRIFQIAAYKGKLCAIMVHCFVSKHMPRSIDHEREAYKELVTVRKATLAKGYLRDKSSSDIERYTLGDTSIELNVILKHDRTHFSVLSHSEKYSKED